MSEKNFRCPQCNTVLYLKDIIGHERDFEGGTCYRKQLEKCDKNYLIRRLTEKYLILKGVEENEGERVCQKDKKLQT